MGLKEQILAKAKERKLVPVKGKGWDGVYIQIMNAAERDAYEGELTERQSAGKLYDNFRATLLVKVLVDDKGNRIFGDEEVAEIGKLPAPEVRKLWDTAAKLNAMTAEDEAQLEGNS